MNEFSPTVYSGSAVLIAYLICQEFNANELEDIGNWFMLFGQFIVTYSGFLPSNDNDNNSTDLDTVKKALKKIEDEIDSIKKTHP